MDKMNKTNKTEEQWQQELTPEQFDVLRKQGTERAFSGRLYNNKETGEYVCAGCGTKLFSSDTKFDSGTGWPSFSEGDNVETREDNKLGMQRTEVVCKKCGGHLGHIFDDGPKPGGKRYCINSCALDFKKS